MWCSPTASPQTHPRVVFFPTSASGLRSSSRTSTLPFDFMAIVAAVMQPAMPAPTTTTSLSSNYNPLERLTAALFELTLGFRSPVQRLMVKRVLPSPRSVAGFSFADLFSGNSKGLLAHAAKFACCEVGKTRLQSHAGDSETSRNLPPHGQRMRRDRTILGC